MIRKICISSSIGNYQSIDVGTIIESILFYDKVFLKCSIDTIEKILDFTGIEDFKNLIELGNLELIVPKNFLGILSQNNDVGERCQYINIIEPLGLNCIVQALQKYNIPLGKSRRIFQHLSKHINLVRAEDSNINNMFEFLNNSEFVTKGFEISSKYYNIHKLFDFNNLQLKIERLPNDQIVIKSNTIIVPEKLDKKLTPENFLVKLMNIKEMFDFAFENDAYFLSDNLSSYIYQNYFFDKIKLIDNSIGIADLFNENIFRDYYSLKDSINHKELKIIDVLKILENSRRFKDDFLNSIENESEIISEYIKYLEKEPWYRSGLASCISFVTTMAIDLLDGNPIASTLWFLYSLRKPWRPNYFVNDLKTYLPPK